MRLLQTAILLAWLAGSAHAQTAKTLWVHRVSDSGAFELSYSGVAWRNLREIIVSVTFGSSTTDCKYYFVCGQDVLLSPSIIQRVGEFDRREYPGKTDADEIIFLGDAQIIDAKYYDGKYGMDAKAASDFFSSVRALCSIRPAATTAPENLLMSTSRSELFHMLPTRFSRSEDNVVIWYQTKPYISKMGKWFGNDMEFDIVDRSAGHEIAKLSIDCKTGFVATIGLYKYGVGGNSTSSNSINEANAKREETVPGSIGESWATFACRIK